MGGSVDRWRIRVAGMMSDAKGEIAECEPVGIANEAKNHAELPIGWRQIDLEASRETRAIAPFGIASAQRLDLDPIIFKPPA